MDQDEFHVANRPNYLEFGFLPHRKHYIYEWLLPFGLRIIGKREGNLNTVCGRGRVFNCSSGRHISLYYPSPRTKLRYGRHQLTIQCPDTFLYVISILYKRFFLDVMKLFGVTHYLSFRSSALPFLSFCLGEGCIAEVSFLE